MQSELIGEGSRFSRLFSLQQRSNVFVSNAWPAPAAYHRSFVNTAVHGPALDAISVRAAVVCVPLLLCAGWRQHTDSAVPSLLLKTGNNTPYPCLASEARAPVCPTWLTEKLRPLCHALEAISIPSFAAVCWQPMDCSHLVFASNIPFRLF